MSAGTDTRHSTPTLAELALLGLLLFLALLPFLVNPIPVANDLHQQVFQARVIASFNDPFFHFPEHYTLDLTPRYTFLPITLLSGLTGLFEPYVAVKIYYLLMFAVLWATARWAFVAMGQSPWAAMLVLPLAHSAFPFLGNYAYFSSIAVSPLLLGALAAKPTGLRRFLLIGGIFLLFYATHVFGIVAGGFTLFVFAVVPKDSTSRPNWLGIVKSFALDCLAALPAIALTLYSMAGTRGGTAAQTIYFAPLNQVKAFFAFFAIGISRPAGILLLAALGTVAVILWLQRGNGQTDRRLIVLALGLIVLDILLPVQWRSWWGVGVRTAAFAAIAAIAALRFSPSAWQRAAIASLALLTATSTLSAIAEKAAYPVYEDFLAGLPYVAPGSKILPIVQQRTAGNLEMMVGIADVYNIYRGGSNPYCFASPRMAFGNSLLNSRLGYPEAHLYDVPPPPVETYRNIGDSYDYIVVFGDFPGLAAVLDSSAKPIFSRNRLTVFQSRRNASKPASNAPARSL